MIELTEARYQMEFGCQEDCWRIVGIALNHPIYGNSEVKPSSPVSIDRVNNTFTTVSGKIYHVTSFNMNEEKFWDQVEKDVNSNGFEIH